MNFRLIFVMDLLDGIVVHARRGERSKYMPIHTFSSLVSTSNPLHIIATIKSKEIYIADLNKIKGKSSNKEIIKSIRDKNRDMKIMLDYGIRSMEDLKEVIEEEIADNIVLGTETASIELIKKASKENINVSVSVDFFNKKVLSSDTKMKIDPFLLIKKLNHYPLKDVIVLELDRVGTKSGIDFDFLSRLVSLSKHNILCGGGVRSCEDVYKMEEIGVKGALVATAIYDRAIPVNCSPASR